MRLENASRGGTRGDNSLASQVLYLVFNESTDSKSPWSIYAVSRLFVVILIFLSLFHTLFRVQVVCWAPLLATATNTTSTSETLVSLNLFLACIAGLTRTLSFLNWLCDICLPSSCEFYFFSSGFNQGSVASYGYNAIENGGNFSITAIFMHDYVT